MLHKFISTLCVEIKCGRMCYADAYTASVLCLNISIDATMSHTFINLADTQNPPTLFLPYAGLTQIQHSGQLPFHRQIL